MAESAPSESTPLNLSTNVHGIMLQDMSAWMFGGASGDFQAL